MVLFKRTYPSVKVDTASALKLSPGESIHSILQYKSQPSPTSNHWSLPLPENGSPTSHPVHIHKVHFGFAALPPILTIKLPVKDYADMSSGQSRARRILLETTQKYFNDADYLAKLLELWSLEDKGKTKTNKRAAICKSIARNNGPSGLRALLKAVHSLGTDSDQWKQKCAADILCGMLYGMKLWDEKTTAEFWTELKPVFNDCLNAVTQETMDAWSVALQYPTVSWRKFGNIFKLWDWELFCKFLFPCLHYLRIFRPIHAFLSEIGWLYFYFL